MNLIALGINHNSAAVEVRERVAFAPEQVNEALVDAIDSARLDEVVILSTCNRTEIYAICRDSGALADKAQQVVEWMANYHHLSADELRDAAYHFETRRRCIILFRWPPASIRWCWASRRFSVS